MPTSSVYTRGTLPRSDPASVGCICKTILSEGSEGDAHKACALSKLMDHAMGNSGWREALCGDLLALTPGDGA